MVAMETQAAQLLNHLGLFVIVTSTVISRVACQCDETAIERVQHCTESLAESGNTGPMGGQLYDVIKSGDVALLRQQCGNGDFLTTINCIERIVDECKDETTDAAHYMRGMFDVEKARNTIRYFCTHFQDFERHSRCITRHHDEQLQCAETAIGHFQTQADATSNMDSQMRFMCTFQEAVYDCITKVLNRYCLIEATALVQTILEGFKPPICASLTSGKSVRTYGALNEDNHSTRLFISSSLLIITFIFWVVKTFKL